MSADGRDGIGDSPHSATNEDLPGAPRDWDGLHATSEPEEWWNTSNVGEALPGVLTPLGWSLWGRTAELAFRQAFHAIGVLPKSEAAVPNDPNRWNFRCFYGRPALLVQSLTVLGDRLPGTSGRQIAEGYLGSIPEEIDFRPTRRYYPAVAIRFPWTFVTVPQRLRKLVGETSAWWSGEISRVSDYDLPTAVATFGDAASRFELNVTGQALAGIGVVQPMYDAISRLVERTGVADVTEVAGGYGGPELEMVTDIWRASRDQMSLEEVAARHGYHGPAEGELSAKVWRDDPEPLRRMIEEYRHRDESASPLERERERRLQRARAEEELLAAVSRAHRPAARGLLRLAASRIPLRGEAKRGFLQALDMARASARCAGEHLAAGGVLSDPEDVFYLTVEELTGSIPADVQARVEFRRMCRERYSRVAVRTAWRGQPEPIPLGDIGDASAEIVGTPVSPGIAEGIARVVIDPSFADVEPDEILIASTTDPSWSSIMFISSALVVDIGGPLSHAAIVARDLGVPCVVNTVSGSRTIRTGDRVRVDGTTGTVTILEPAAAPLEPRTLGPL